MLVKSKVKHKKQGIKKLTMYRPQVRSRHPSHGWLKNSIGLLPFRSIVRLGSTTQIGDEVSVGGRRVECNTVQAIKTSASKLLMKQVFLEAGVKTAEWYYCWIPKYTDGHIEKAIFMKSVNIGNMIETTPNTINDLPYPIVAKHHYGSRGEGNFLINSQQELDKWMSGKTLSNYIFEKFYNYSREYRLHVTKDGCFYTCRKMLKGTTPAESRWYRNDSNSVWVLEDNPQFDKPVNWATIVAECVKALKAVGLDVGAIDLKVQSAKTEKGELRKDPQFIVIETNSAPSMGNITQIKYQAELPKILNFKWLEINK